MRRLLVAAVALVCVAITSAADPTPVAGSADASAVLLPAVDGFVRGDDNPGGLGSVIRNFTSPHASIILLAVPLATGFGLQQTFDLVTRSAGGDRLPAPEFGLATWIVGAGETEVIGPSANLTFAGPDWIFDVLVLSDDPASVDPEPIARTVATAQLARGGGPVAPAAAQSGVDDPALAPLIALLPGDVGSLHVLTTADAREPVGNQDQLTNAVAGFLDEHTTGVLRVWDQAEPTGATSVAVSLTQYPYTVFAAASVGEARRSADTRLVPAPDGGAIPDAVWFAGTGPRTGQMGVAFRRGTRLVLVLGLAEPGVPEADLTGSVEAIGSAVSNALGPGSSSIYRFPGRRSTLQSIGLSTLLVTGSATSVIGVGRLRARRSRRRRSGATSLPPPSGGIVIPLDADAHRLRRRGAVVVVGQLLSLDVGIGALAGDFGWAGVAVAAVALLAGIGFTAWWRGYEQRAIGPAAPRALRLPRPAGLALGVLAASLLGLGVGFAVKGLRYLVLPPSLAQLHWSDFLHISPRAVGAWFAVGGLVVAVAGSALFRVARAWARAGTRATLADDPRPPVLYLRSFEDDAVPLATIVSARRPFLELLSIRGADPFEESLAWELTAYGPVVAVARPGHSSASLGAAREHLSDETWQAQVSERMAAAALIVVAIGETAGLRWELTGIVRSGWLTKALFVFPPVEADLLERRWAHTADALRAAGAEVGQLPAPVELVHSVSLRPDGTVVATTAARRDDASYRTAMDRAVERAT